MIYVTVLLALCAAFLNALSSVMQRHVAGQPEPQELFRKNFIKGLITSRLWLMAYGIEVIAFLFQAGALKNGSLVFVQPILVMNLVFIMLILHFHYRIKTGPREWVAVALICIGLSGLLLSASPGNGDKPFEPFVWTLATLVIVVLIGIGIFIVRRTRSAHWRAGLSGLAAGLSFALLAAFTKLATEQLEHGVLATLTSWQVYALLASGILAAIMTQNTYGAGPLAMSQPVMDITEPLVSIVLGIVLFGETINLSAGNLTIEAVTAVLAGVGIWLMASSKRLYASPH